MALLSRAAKEIAEDKIELESIVGEIGPTLPVLSLEARIDLAVYAVTMKIVFAAAEEVGCQAPFLLTKPVPSNAPIITAFGLVILSGMYSPLANEGYKFDPRKAGGELVTQMLLMHPIEERVRLYTDAAAILQQVTRAEAANVQEWRNNTINLVPLYLLQFTTVDPKLKEMKLLPLFGGLLKSFLAAGE